VGSFAGAATRRKCIDGTQRSAQFGWKPNVDGKAKSWPDMILISEESWHESVA